MTERSARATPLCPARLDNTIQPPVERLRLTGKGSLPADQTSFDDEVLAALDNLEATARACLLLRVVLDMPYAEISRILDLPAGTAMSHVHRARRVLSDHLGPSNTSVIAS